MFFMEAGSPMLTPLWLHSDNARVTPGHQSPSQHQADHARVRASVWSSCRKMTHKIELKIFL